MDQNVKNRLVGISVIFALAVIFLPMILDGSGVRKHKLEVIIPPQPLVSANPEFESKVMELQAKVDALPDLEPRFVDGPANVIEREPQTDANATDPAAAQRESSAASKRQPAAVAAKPKAITGGNSWVLQVGSFHDRGKALTQRDKLRKSKIAAVFIEQFNINNKASFRVRLGPFLDRGQTRVAQNKIKAKHDIDGIIMKYER